MSFEGTLAYSIARAADVFTASVFTKHDDVTISSECDVELKKTEGNRFLCWLGRVLNRIQKDHTSMARTSDIERAKTVIQYLGG